MIRVVHHGSGSITDPDQSRIWIQVSKKHRIHGSGEPAYSLSFVKEWRLSLNPETFVR
jgi:hypothetical protein